MGRTRRSRDNSGNTSAPKLRRTHRYNTRSRARRAALLGGEQEGRSIWLSDEERRKRTELLKPLVDVPGKALGVKSVNLNKEENGYEHRTNKYEISDLVVRRGQPFSLTITFDRDVNPDYDAVVLQLVFGTKPQESKGTLLRLKLNLKEKTEVCGLTGKWKGKADKLNGPELTALITPPANALVGQYGLFVESQLKGDDGSTRRFEVEDEDIYIIFNAWCKDDVVYMSDEREREEYVLNDHGRIWVGSVYNNRGRPWNFGQFDNPVLEATFQLIDNAEIGDTARRSPVTFVRAISSQANSCDDDGVLEGRWTESYPKGCTLPWAWTGSVRILEMFMATGKPVQFGQCWVFSGLTTSLLRSIGIPTRSVTNFESAHDTDSSMTIDTHFDADDEPVSWMDDSVWNFHVWNESYFRRIDLPSGYDGWQAHDATPQELSEGVMRCGPAPLKAIRAGHVYLNYDVPFIFSEVNGDKVNWRVGEKGEMEVIDIDSFSVGKCISTKAVGSNERHDVTLEYKYPEGSEEERKVVEFVNRYSSRESCNIYDCDIVKDLEFKLREPEATMIGDDFKVCVKIKSKSMETRRVTGRITVLSSFYTGVPGKRIKGEPVSLELDPRKDGEVFVTVYGADYQGKLNPEASFQVYASLHVSSTGQRFGRSVSFSLDKPDLQIEVPDVIKAKEESEAVVTFTNPLVVALTGGMINIEGASVMSADSHSFRQSIQPGETVSFKFILCPRRAGCREIQATFSSDQLCGVDGSVEFEVEPADD